MRIPTLAAIAWTLAGTASAQSQQQFDLVCDVRNVATGRPSSTFHAHVDLAAMRWCEAPCTNAKTLQSARNVLLLTVSAESQPGGGYLVTRRSVDRTTGAYEFRVSHGSRVVSHLTGTCRVQPYGSPVQRLF